ncbi:MAG: class I SAM-dependent methyltransferase [Sediminibacterium sp.]
MQYPVKLSQISAEKAIYIPDYKQVKEVYASLIKIDPNTPFPFWAKLWPSSIALVNVLENNPNWIRDKHVLELGAGIGLPSLMLAGLVKSIQVSDYADEAVELLQKNIAHLNLMNVQALLLDWNHLPVSIQPDVLILSDVNYDPSQFDTLIQIITSKILDGCTILLATPQRIMASPFVQALETYIQTTYVEVVNENASSIEISILVLSK